MTSLNVSIDSHKIIPLIYHGAVEEKPWQPFLQQLRIAMDADVAAITLRPGTSHIPPLIIWDRSTPLTKTEIRQAELDHAQLIDEDPLSNALTNPGDIFVLDEVISRNQLVTTGFYKKLMQPYDIEHQMGMYFSEPEGWACTIGLMRGTEKTAFGKYEKNYFLELLPHLEQGLTLYARIRHSETERNIFEGTLSRLGVGVIMLDRNSNIIESNTVAKNLLQQHNCISVVNNKFFVKHNKNLINSAIAAAQQASVQYPATDFVEAIRVAPTCVPELGILIRSVSAGLYQSNASPRVIIYVSNPLQDNIGVRLMLGFRA